MTPLSQEVRTFFMRECEHRRHRLVAGRRHQTGANLDFLTERRRSFRGSRSISDKILEQSGTGLRERDGQIINWT